MNHLRYTGLLLFVLAMPCAAQRYTISEETTRFTSPLSQDGSVDYFKALEERNYPPEMKTDDNGFRIVTRLFGDIGTTKNHKDSEFYRLQKYEKLGLDPEIKPTLTLPDAPDRILLAFYEKNGNKKDMPDWNKTNIGSGRPWTLEEYPMFADWVNEMDKPLDAIAEAVRKPVFFIPYVQSLESVESGKPQFLIAMLLPDIQLCRDIARMFQTRANYRIAQGDIDGAIDDQLTMLRLGRQVGQDGTLIQCLVSIACEGLAHAVSVNANPEHPLTEKQIRRLLAGLDALPPRAPIANAFEWERYMGLDAVQRLATGDVSITDLAGIDNGFVRVLFQKTDWDIVFRRMNEMYDVMQEPTGGEKVEAIIKAIEEKSKSPWKVTLHFLSSKGRGHLAADMMICIFTPAVDAAKEAVRRMECMENMQRLTLAMLLYQCEHGTLPDENWAEQITPSLGENPAQWFSCPTQPSPEGQTTYALVQYGDKLPADLDTILLVELAEPVPLDKAVISVDDVLARKRMGGQHTGGMNAGFRGGAVRFLASSISVEEWRRMLGLE